MNHAFRTVALLLVLAAASAAFCNETEKSTIPAFPGAEGYGAASVGGRGGKVLKVTTLEATGPGSLSWALEEDYPRIIVFDVSGVIGTGQNFHAKHSRLTIAGQTAPGAGITLKGSLSVGNYRGKRTADHIVRFLRVRPDFHGSHGGGGDGIQVVECDRVILDHISTSWSTDEAISYKYTSGTLQWSSCDGSDFAWEGHHCHNYGAFMNKIKTVSLHHTLIAHASERCPCQMGGFLDLRNTVVYNSYVGSHIAHSNAVNNYYREGPGGPQHMRPNMPAPRPSRPRLEIKRGDSYCAGNVFDYTGGAKGKAKVAKPRRDTPNPCPPVKTHSAEEAYKLVLAHAGCLPRDAVSWKTFREVYNRSGFMGRYMPEGGLMQGLKPGTPKPDTDGDGMPDAWETARGLNPKDPSDTNKIVPAGASKNDRHKGYTYIEYYINDCADRLVEEAVRNYPASFDKPETAAVVSPAETGKDQPASTAKLEPASELVLRPGVTAGCGHSATLRPDGTVWGWGMASHGSFGDGTTGAYGNGTKEAKQARGPGGEGKLTGIKAISSIMTSTVGLREDGTVWAWGRGKSGQMGNGETKSSSLPVQVKSSDGKGVFTDAVAVAAGQTHAAALKADGTVWVWGLNDRGQLGNGSNVKLSALPVQVKSPDGKGFLQGVIGIAAGAGHCLAVRRNGTVLAWGENVVGQVGDGTTTDRFLPVVVNGVRHAVSVSVGWNSSFAVCRDGSAWGWGYNVFSQLGDGTAYDRHRPVRMKDPDGKAPMTGVLRVASGSVHTLIVKKDGTLWACGGNHFMQLGIGRRSAQQDLPVQVAGPRGKGLITGVEGAAAGSVHSAAVTADGTVYCWGDNSRYQIGDPAVPAIGSCIMNGELIDSARAKREGLYKKGAIGGPGPPFPWPAVLPSERAVPILNTMETIGPESGDRVNEAIGHLGDEEVLVRMAALRALGKIEGAASEVVPALAGKVDDEDGGVRMKAVRLLGRCDPSDARVVSALTMALKGGDSKVAYAACRALGKFREAASAAVPDLWAATRRGGALGSECYDSLAKIGGPAVDVLVRALQDPENSRGHVMCVIALGSMGPRAAPAVPALIQALESKQEQVRQKAAKALGGIGPDAKPAMAALKKALNDESKAVRYNAKKALKRLAPAND